MIKKNVDIIEKEMQSFKAFAEEARRESEV